MQLESTNIQTEWRSATKWSFQPSWVTAIAASHRGSELTRRELIRSFLSLPSSRVPRLFVFPFALLRFAWTFFRFRTPISIFSSASLFPLPPSLLFPYFLIARRKLVNFDEKFGKTWRNNKFDIYIYGLVRWKVLGHLFYLEYSIFMDKKILKWRVYIMITVIVIYFIFLVQIQYLS